MSVPLNPDPDRIREFLELLHGASPGYIGISRAGAGYFRSAFFDSIDAACEHVLRVDADEQPSGIYLRMTTLAEKPAGGRGTESDSYVIPGLWSDIDFGEIGHAHEPDASRGQLPLPPDEDSARRIVTTSGLPQPSAWVHSGGGFYAFWLLEKPEEVARLGLEHWRRLSAGWQQVLENAARSLGYHYGAGVGDLSRVLRIAGTVNRKAGLERECRLISSNGPRYTADELAEHLERLEHQGSDDDSEPAQVLDFAAARAAKGSEGSGKPFDVLAAAASWDVLLGAAGWTHVGRDEAGELYRRPGDPESEYSARVLDARPEVLVVHSESAGLPAGGRRRLTKGKVFAWLHFAGDVKAAAKDLAAYAAGEDDTITEKVFAGHPDVLLALARRVTTKPKGESQASRLVAMARERYRLFKDSNSNRFYAVPLTGPNIALPLKGSGGLRRALAGAFFTTEGTAPGQGALTDAMNTLEHFAEQAEPEPVHLRVARHGDGVVIDMGTADGKCIVVKAGSWSIESSSPVLFRRNAATAAMPEPVRSEAGPHDGVKLLGELLNADDEQIRLAWALLVSYLLPNIPRLIVYLRGEQGTAKTSAAKTLTGIIDPSPAPVRTPPRDADAWILAASSSYVVALDNLSFVPVWLSDALCRAVTGDGDAKRVLYSDDDLHIVSFRRAIILAGIDIAGIQPDLADRLVPLDLTVIPAGERREDAEVEAARIAAHPVILGALLDTLAGVLEVWDTVKLTELPRMADAARVLACVDRVMSTDEQTWDTLATYLKLTTNTFAALTDADVFARAVKEFLEREGTFTGTVGELLGELERRKEVAEFLGTQRRPKAWPADATRAGGRLTRMAPALRAEGFTVTELPRGDRGGRRWELAAPDPDTTTHTHIGERREHSHGSHIATKTAGQRPRSKPVAHEEPVARHGGPDNDQPVSKKPIYLTPWDIPDDQAVADTVPSEDRGANHGPTTEPLTCENVANVATVAKPTPPSGDGCCDVSALEPDQQLVYDATAPTAGGGRWHYLAGIATRTGLRHPDVTAACRALRTAGLIETDRSGKRIRRPDGGEEST